MERANCLYLKTRRRIFPPSASFGPERTPLRRTKRRIEGNQLPSPDVPFIFQPDHARENRGLAACNPFSARGRTQIPPTGVGIQISKTASLHQTNQIIMGVYDPRIVISAPVTNFCRMSAANAPRPSPADNGGTNVSTHSRRTHSEIIRFGQSHFCKGEAPARYALSPDASWARRAQVFGWGLLPLPIDPIPSRMRFALPSFLK